MRPSMSAGVAWVAWRDYHWLGTAVVIPADEPTSTEQYNLINVVIDKRRIGGRGERDYCLSVLRSSVLSVLPRRRTHRRITTGAAAQRSSDELLSIFYRFCLILIFLKA